MRKKPIKNLRLFASPPPFGCQYTVFKCYLALVFSPHAPPFPLPPFFLSLSFSAR